MQVHAPLVILTALRGVQWRLNRMRVRLTIAAAQVRRHFLPHVLFIGVTGSAGKTTTKELIVALLSRQWHGRSSYITENWPYQLARLVLRTTSSDRFCVCELTATARGAIGQSLRIVRPKIGVVTSVGDDHISVYKTRAAIAQEKGGLVAALPADGTAVLNADDELVAGMRERCRGRVVTYGLAEGADVRAEQVSSAWPERLRLTVVAAGEKVVVQTQLCGSHWTHAVLAAVGTGVGVGIPLQECARALAETPPFLARMQPLTTPDGVTFIRDDWKAPLWTTHAAFEFMQQARAPRKVIVVGTLSDYGGDASAQYARVAVRALQAADHVVFVGAWASRALRAAPGGHGDRLRAFSSVRQASDHLNGVLQPGDLVLLKGTNRKDHLLRIVLARGGQVGCWRDDCARIDFCADCPQLALGPAAPAGEVRLLPEEEQPTTLEAMNHVPVVIGLGNPGVRYAGTPHSIGHRVLDRVGVVLDARWVEEGDALLARVRADGRDLCLIKLQVAMNASGPAILALSRRLRFVAADCILVHDDLDLPLGSVRARLRGSAGGHRGVASVLDAFQSDAIRRVKIGIGRPDAAGNVTDYVLRPLAEADRAIVEQACSTAVERILHLATGQAGQKRKRERSLAAGVENPGRHG
jgi:aminoacyl-tRNA hydrolase